MVPVDSARLRACHLLHWPQRARRWLPLRHAENARSAWRRGESVSGTVSDRDGAEAASRDSK